ncbi:chain length determinant protein EpsF [Herbaspirillum lusitanum]|uniref:chain length determinant protein EpsF n=1 Tax=Herbaspirillum lusitanum TaxID=213312 RepID=UPI0002F34C73|nr:chain length determinant protein EpsF [Herbaspirillum lusitanum]MCW5299748.1 chain length determinant protein EpsF [Herbaspirillum lusitanum]
MTFFQIRTIVRTRYKLILTTLLIVIAATVAVSLALPKTYRATTSLLLNYKGTDPVSGHVLAAQQVSGYMATQMDIVTSRSVALKVVDNLRLADDPNAQQRYQKVANGNVSMRDWLADSLLKMVELAPSRESSVIEISAKGSDPKFVASVANAFAAAYQQINLQIKLAPLQQASQYFSTQVKTLRSALEQAQNKLSKYQQDHGIVSTDSSVDVATARLNELSTQLVQAQSQAIEASSRGSQAMGRDGRDSPDVASNMLIQNLKASLAQAQAKFAMLSQNLDHNHPQYQAAKAEVDRLQAALNNSISSTNNSVANNGRILRQREAEIRAALEAQTAKLLQMNRARDELSVLSKDVENAQHAYDAAAQRLAQTDLEGNANQSDVVLLNPAVIPGRPASPNIALNAVLAVLLGATLGLALAILAELTNRRVRSSDDLLTVLQAPVLGAVAWRKPLRKSGFSNLFLSH